MYDELVKRLRKKAEAFDYDGWVETASDYEKAADAIEELQKAVLRLEEESGILDELPIYQQPVGWIPVTERLPEIQKVVLITDGIDVGTGWMNRGRWNTPFADIQRDLVTHWMPLPEPPKEET